MRWSVGPLLVACLLFNGDVWAQKIDQKDLTTGIVFPSNNDAIIMNPAHLGAKNQKLIDANIWTDSQFSTIMPNISYVYGGGEAGFGFYYLHSNTSANLYSAFGMDFDDFQGGMNVNFDIRNFFFTFDLGLRLGGQEDFAAAIVVPNIFEWQREWELGFGFGDPFDELSGEINFLARHEFDNVGLQLFEVRPALHYAFAGEFSAHLRYGFRIIPDFTSSFRDLEVGAAIRASKTFAIYGVMNFIFAEWAFGVKINT